MSVRASRLLLLLGVFGLVWLFTYAHATALAPIPYDPVGTSRFWWTLVFTGALILGAYAAGLPDLPRSRTGAAFLGLAAFSFAVVVVSLIQLVLGSALLPRAVLLGVGLTIVPWSVLVWNTQADVAVRAVRRVVFVGRQDEGAALASEIALHSDTVVAELVSTLPVQQAAGQDGLLAEVAHAEADVVILSLAAQDEQLVVSQAASLHKQGVRIRTQSLFTEEFLGKLALADLQRVALLFDVGELHRLRYQRAKRVVDVAFGIAAAPVLLVVALPVWIGNLLTSRGPLFYRQERVGKDGESFTIYKFRSMHVGGDSSWTLENDDRITLAGKVLRPTHLDELPQLLNILRGDLSLVGPRPEQVDYVDELRTKIQFYDVRHLVRPGLTGWAQVCYAYGADTEDALEKLQYDLYYLRRQSMAMDLRIIVRTLREVIRGTGR